MKYTVIRGTKDILPDEVPYWQQIESTCRTVFENYNFQELRTPVFEMTELFERSIGKTTDIVEKEMYTFTDKGDRSITLRPEGTAPIVRAYIQNGLHKTQKSSKLFYVGPMFRYERPQAGRYRQFHQIGVEHLGCQHPFADAETISLGVRIFDQLGLQGLSVSINSVGCKVCRPVIEEQIKQFIGHNLKHLCEDCNRRYNTQPLRILDCKKEKCKTYCSGLPDMRKALCQDCSDHFSSVLEYLDSLRISFNINPLLVRGLDYYTKTAFEIVSDQLGAQNAVCGGGRYDRLVNEIGGPSTPAVGFAFGIERAVMILKKLEAGIDTRPLDVFLIGMDDTHQTKCFNIMDKLRKKGFSCEMAFGGGSIKSQMKAANRLNARYTIIYGDEEAEKKRVLLKNMKRGSQKPVPLSRSLKELIHEVSK